MGIASPYPIIPQPPPPPLGDSTFIKLILLPPPRRYLWLLYFHSHFVAPLPVICIYLNFSKTFINTRCARASFLVRFIIARLNQAKFVSRTSSASPTFVYTCYFIYFVPYTIYFSHLPFANCLFFFMFC